VTHFDIDTGYTTNHGDRTEMVEALLIPSASMQETANSREELQRWRLTILLAKSLVPKLKYLSGGNK